MNNSHLIYFIKHQTFFTMKTYRQRLLSFLPIVLLAILSLSPVFQSCDNPYAQSESERERLQAENDKLIDVHSCEMAEKEKALEEKENALFAEQYTNTLQQDSIKDLKKRNYALYKRKVQLQNANKGLIEARDSLKRRSQTLQLAIATHTKELEEYKELDNSNSTVIAEKEEKIRLLEQEFDTVLQLIETDFGENANTGSSSEIESYAVALDGNNNPSSGRFDKAKQYVKTSKTHKLNEFAKELQVSLFTIPKDADGKPVHKRNPIKFREKWRSVNVTASISHPNENKLNNSEYLNELVAVVRNHHNGLSGYRPVTETSTKREQLTIPYTDNTLNFDYYVDKQTSGSFFTVSLHYRNPLSNELIFLAEQTIFSAKNTPTPSVKVSSLTNGGSEGW